MTMHQPINSQVNPWVHALSAVSRAITAIVGRVRFPLYRRTSANTSGSAPSTSQTGKPVSQKQLPLILAEREILIRQIAQSQRHHRATYSAAKRLREITHQQLKLELQSGNN